MTTDPNKKSHRDRKNPRSREQYEEQRKKKNEARGKQVWIPYEFDRDFGVQGGYWYRQQN